MPIHDWTRVPAGVFHHFHSDWIHELTRILNHGTLPHGYYALTEPRKRVAIRHISGHRMVAIVEIVSPGNKSGRDAFRDLVEKVILAIREGIHVLVLDLFPPGRRDPNGVHAAIWKKLASESFALPTNPLLTLASYAAGEETRSFVEVVNVGDPLPEMPLFLESDSYVNVDLETTYSRAFENLPETWAEILNSPSRPA